MPIIQAAYSLNAPVAKIAESVHLPLYALEDSNRLIAEIPAWYFVDAVTRLEGDNLFGLRIGSTSSFQDITTVKPLLNGCHTLKCLLTKFCQTAHLQSTNNYMLEENGDLVWFSQKQPPFVSGCAAEQVELFEVSGMMQLVQMVAGRNWRPTEIHLRAAKNKYTENAHDLNPGRICYLKPFPSIAIQRHMLALPVPQQEVNPTQSTDGTGAYDLMEAPVQFNQVLLSIIGPYLGSSKLTPEALSRITGLSFRTLQRRLKSLIKARQLMEDPELRLLDIALMLGYENASAFTRAFKRWTCLTPQEYRRHYSTH